MSTLVQRVVVVGSGSEAWLAAAALKRAFRHVNLDVVVLEPGSAADSPLAQWTLPSLRSLHGLLGIRESDFMRETGATFRLASEHQQWQNTASGFIHAYGEIGVVLNRIPFYKYLLLRALRRQAEPVEIYSLAATAARLGRFARPMESANSLTASFTYAFHIDERPYSEFLRRHAEKLGVRIVRGTFTGVSRLPDGRVQSLSVADQAAITGDYFLDCSGREALLMSSIASLDRDDWSAWLPADRRIAAHAAALTDAAPLTRTVATESGWMWQMPLARSSAAGYVYSSRAANDGAALAQLRGFANVGDDVTTRPLKAGRRKQFWNANCIAIGTTAMELEPLAGADLHLAQFGIAALVELFPLNADSSLEAIEYNRILSAQADSLRDFTIAHYRAAAPRSGEYWRAAASHPAPDSLAARLDLFRANGRITLLDHEAFEETDWAWLLLGTGCLPAALELHMTENLRHAAPEHFATLRAAIQSLAASMPRHMDHFERRA
ncbi:MAG TPA: tryptophan halogenase family protein [Povalibacter sp.]|nr:tryptophan halogenase family protein [Povalibacter sp.]